MFVLLCVETMDPWGPEPRHFFKELSSRLIEATTYKRTGGYLNQHIGLAIQRNNTASLLGTMTRGGNSDLGEVSYLRRLFFFL